MADMVFVKFFTDDLIAMEELSYEEKGRLFEAMILYASTGEKPDLPGNERFVFPWMKARADRDKEGISARRREAGKKGAASRWGEREAASVPDESIVENDTENSKNDGKNGNDSNAIFSDGKMAIKKEEGRRKKEEGKEKKEEGKGGINRARARFIPPTEEMVAEYCRENGINVNAQRFVSFYESKGWKVGKEPMEDWQAAVRGWVLRDAQEIQSRKYKVPKLIKSYTEEDLAFFGRDDYDIRGSG